MAILKVARLGHPVLRQVARELPREEILSPAMRQLVADMKLTMAEYNGVGLAAPQVHCSVRAAVVEFGENNPRYEVEGPQPAIVFFNPRITVLDDTKAGFWEGCLSVPGMRGYVERPSKLQVDYLDEHAEPQTLSAEGFLATVLQHEFDHLDGILYVDRLADPTRFAFNEEYARFHAG
ncbi:MAG: peptide deformylase [Myxococcales bacterium]|nr:peptide deformylase [Myxococcales bacterium]MDD9966390.1 peptide deformylase [Myxococcales bacterium]